MRPYKSPYKDHGSRHAPGGTDPIPGLATGSAIPFAKASPGSFTTVAAISGGVPGTAYMNATVPMDYNSDTSVFADSSATAGGGTVHGIGVLVPGHYLMKAQVVLNAMTGTGLVEVDSINLSGGTVSAYGSAGRRWIRQTGDSGNDGFYLEQIISVGSGDGPFPTGPFTVIVSNSTNATLSAFADILVFQLDGDGTHFF